VLPNAIMIGFNKRNGTGNPNIMLQKIVQRMTSALFAGLPWAKDLRLSEAKCIAKSIVV
jgi:hypothetical protein